MYIIISYKLRSTTPLPLPPVPFNCKAKGVWILTSAVWISALVPVKLSGRRRFHDIWKFESGLTVCHWKWTAERSRVYESTFCTYLWFSVFMCAAQYLSQTVCMYIHISIFSACTFLLWLLRVWKCAGKETSGDVWQKKRCERCSLACLLIFCRNLYGCWWVCGTLW